MALISLCHDLQSLASRLEKAGLAEARAQLAALLDWVVEECDRLQGGAYRELAGGSE